MCQAENEIADFGIDLLGLCFGCAQLLQLPLYRLHPFLLGCKDGLHLIADRLDFSQHAGVDFLHHRFGLLVGRLCDSIGLFRYSKNQRIGKVFGDFGFRDP